MTLLTRNYLKPLNNVKRNNFFIVYSHITFFFCQMHIKQISKARTIMEAPLDLGLDKEIEDSRSNKGSLQLSTSSKSSACRIGVKAYELPRKRCI